MCLVIVIPFIIWTVYSRASKHTSVANIKQLVILHLPENVNWILIQYNWGWKTKTVWELSSDFCGVQQSAYMVQPSGTLLLAESFNGLFCPHGRLSFHEPLRVILALLCHWENQECLSEDLTQALFPLRQEHQMIIWQLLPASWCGEHLCRRGQFQL